MRTDNPYASAQWSCNRKKAYSDERIAKKVARGRSEKSDVDLVAYGCGHCGFWHVGRRRYGDVQRP